MIRVLPTENILDTNDPVKPKKIRNYSFQKSKRLPLHKMTEVNGVKIPSIPGSCYHAIIAALAEYKEKFCTWDKIIKLTNRNMCMYGGQNAWNKFIAKNNVKSYERRIKDNTHTLTRTGKDCYGHRLHELGMCIYYFKDGAMLLTGGTLKTSGDSYNVIFQDGRKLQTRYRGTTMTYKEYRIFFERGYIDDTGKILDVDGIKKIRATGAPFMKDKSFDTVTICIELKDSFDQNTAYRLEKLGLCVDQCLNNELIGTIARNKLKLLRSDPDIKEVEVSG